MKMDSSSELELYRFKNVLFLAVRNGRTVERGGKMMFKVFKEQIRSLNVPQQTIDRPNNRFIPSDFLNVNMTGVEYRRTTFIRLQFKAELRQSFIYSGFIIGNLINGGFVHDG